MSVEETAEALIKVLEEEIRLVELQLGRCRRFSTSLAITTPKRPTRPSPAKPSFSEPSTPQVAERSPEPTSPVAPPKEVPQERGTKSGTLLHLARRTTLLGATEEFVEHYFVVNASGISWYSSLKGYETHPDHPLGRIPFFVETKNSRGSRFKKAAVCWPVVDDCAKVTDPSVVYFMVDYSLASGESKKLYLGASSATERNEWVTFLTQYIDLYLPPDADSEELQKIEKGADVPVHRSHVIEGEAPGGTIL
ncbi:hypothetical protein AGDE_00207 [Angomonas deanei]|uniref:PH domain-containing protein n=1 Tax=Angomonas deanei TaxID=59799 RepID=A0A7G2C954_9TRYP|nr:hypothetical protein AGDE_00207 [Angomonas deanei]CAD2215975.1 hypothetical protein, conserved [Angomonas deanei]|eukprot:EPY43714.1 hypothetical protein AGDE_00207 [Angomonas deanei]